MQRRTDQIARRLFVFSVMLFVFGYGMIVGKYEIFPYHVFAMAGEKYTELRANNMLGGCLPFGYIQPTEKDRPALYNTGDAQPGVNLMVHVKPEQRLGATIMDLTGKVLNEWDLDWFEIWPDATHLPNRLIPRSRPGTHIHGATIMPNGDLVFNFNQLGLVRIDRDGEVVWRLPYQTHHTVHLHDDGNLWVPGTIEHDKKSDRFPNRVPPFVEYTLLEVSPNGKILREWSVPDLLRDNGLNGLLYLRTVSDHNTEVRGEVLHLNDVEPFPETLEEGFFKKGDVLVSLRNINTIFVFNSATGKIKFVSTGRVIWQHDPDFIDGNTISVFDNNPTHPGSRGRSRIVTLSAPEGNLKIAYEGTPEAPFFTAIMGKHQCLPNGNILIAETRRGRAFEVNRRGEIVWEYTNYLDDQHVGIIEQVERLPLEYAELYDRSAAAEFAAGGSHRPRRISAAKIDRGH